MKNIEKEIPSLKANISNFQYGNHTEQIYNLESLAGNEREILDSLEDLPTEEQILAILDLGSAKEEYLELMGITATEQSFFAKEGTPIRSFSALSLLNLPGGRTPLYLIIISIIILAATYMARHKLFPTEKESQMRRIEKKIQLRNQ